jgi:hypothetical protein
MNSNELTHQIQLVEDEINKLASHLRQRVNNEAIAGHKAAIDTYIKVIADFMPFITTNPLINQFVESYIEEIAVLRKELQEMKEKTTVP